MTQKTPSLRTRLAYTQHGSAIRFSWNYIRQAKIASLLTFLVLGGALALPTIFGLFVANLSQINLVKGDANSLTLYLKPNISDQDGLALASRIETLPEFVSVRYISRDEALESFQKQFTLANAVDSLDKNPLPGAIVAKMSINNEDEVRIQLLSDKLRDYREVELVKYDLRWLKRLNAILTLSSRAAILIGTLLVFIALLVVGNTIRLEVARRSSEVVVSHLVGASASQLKRPFLYSGLFYGFFGGLLALFMVSMITLSLGGPAGEISKLYGNSIEIQGLNLDIILMIMLTSCTIGLIGALIAAQLQIKQILTQLS